MKKMEKDSNDLTYGNQKPAVTSLTNHKVRYKSNFKLCPCGAIRKSTQQVLQWALLWVPFPVKTYVKEILSAQHKIIIKIDAGEMILPAQENRKTNSQILLTGDHHDTVQCILCYEKKYDFKKTLAPLCIKIS